MEENFIRFRNTEGREYEIGLVNDEIMIDAGEGGLLTLDEYYEYADAEAERAWFDAMGGEIRQTIIEAAEDPEYDNEIEILPEDLGSVARIPRKIELWGHEMIEKRVGACGNSGRVYVDPRWIGHRVAVIRLD